MLPDAFVEIMVCPKSKQPLIYFPRGEDDTGEGGAFLLSPSSLLRYRIDEVGVPVLIVEEATELTPAEVARLVDKARRLGLRIP